MTNKIEPSVIQKAINLYLEGELRTSDVCKECGISWGTLHNYLNKYKINRRNRRRSFRGRTPVNPEPCSMCEDAQKDPLYNTRDFFDSINGILYYKATLCKDCGKKYFKSVDVKTGEIKHSFL